MTTKKHTAGFQTLALSSIHASTTNGSRTFDESNLPFVALSVLLPRKREAAWKHEIGNASAQIAYRYGDNRFASRRGTDDLAVHAGISAKLTLFRPILKIEEIAEELKCALLVGQANSIVLPRFPASSVAVFSSSATMRDVAAVFSCGLRSNPLSFDTSSVKHQC